MISTTQLQDEVFGRSRVLLAVSAVRGAGPLMGLAWDEIF